MRFEVEIPLRHTQNIAELAEEATEKETAVGDSIILTISVIGFLINLKS